MSLFTAEAPGLPARLLALREPETGALTFPRSAFGCTTTGRPAAALEPVALSGRATVLACITLHQPVLPGLAPPVRLAELRLAEGPVVQGVIEGAGGDLPPGSAVQAVMAADGVSCLFRPVPPA
ncbi:Zn-ribbon domain-containing OB-fold protein [Falsiroseomonas selenitidurans]|uniref:ChsH2 C-terminal OB-fold domain-containing protein n=1 Tax=Falsiroseomonas selenitidurans TaxID=2716335 RepID=A0ABX1E984_9PROT|nr:OB-fold domain-containing protein [Falsiroseomonas selenitidurans]NKC33441.1 hypothetical protein [Falsiroseomonas selenitidurans]